MADNSNNALIDELLPIIERLENKDLGVTPDDEINTRISSAGAVGRYQIMPGTAQALGRDPSQLTDVDYNKETARLVLQDLIRQHGHDREAIIAGYNTSPLRARRFADNKYDTSYLLPETQDYISRYREITGQSSFNPPENFGHVWDETRPSGWNMLQSAMKANFPNDEIVAWKQRATEEAIKNGFSAEEVAAYWGDYRPAPVQWAALGDNVVGQYTAENPKVAEGMFENVAAAVLNSATGMMFTGMPVVTPNPDGFFETAAVATVGMASDLGVMILGGLAGTTTGGPIAGAAATMATPTAIREAIIQSYMIEQYGMPTTFREGMEQFGTSALNIGRDGVIGTLFGPGGQIGQALAMRGGQALLGTSRMATSAGLTTTGRIIGTGGNLVGQEAAATIGEGILYGHMPTAEEFWANAVAMGAIGVVQGYGQRRYGQWAANRELTKFQARMAQIYARTGILPNEVVAAANNSHFHFLSTIVPENIHGEPIGPYAKRGVGDFEALRPKQESLGDHFIEDTIPDTGDTPRAETSVRPNRLTEAVDTDFVPAHPDEGRVGQFQVNPDQAKKFGYDPTQLEDPLYNGRAAGGILTQLTKRFRGDGEAAHIAYLADEGVADAWLASGRKDSILPARVQRAIEQSRREGAYDYLGLTAKQEAALEEAAGKVMRADAGKDPQGNPVLDDSNTIGSYIQNYGRQAGFNIWVGDAETQSAAVHSGVPYRHPHYRPYNRSVFIPETPEHLNRRWYGLGRYEIIHHEVGHAIDYTALGHEAKVTSGDSKRQANEGYEWRRNTPIHEEMLRTSKIFRPKLWEMGGSHNQKSSELMADNIAMWISAPWHRKNMKLFGEMYGARLAPYVEIAEKALPVRMEDGTWARSEQNPGSRDWTWGKSEGTGGGGDGGPPRGTQTVLPPEDGGPFRKIDTDYWRDKMDPEMLLNIANDMISKPDPRNFTDWGKDAIETAYDRYVTELGPAQRLDRMLTKLNLQKEGSTLIEDAFRSTYASAIRAGYFIKEGPLDAFSFEKTGAPSLHAAYEAVVKRGGTMDGFQGYRIAQRHVELRARGIDPGTPLRDADALKIIQDPKLKEKYDEGLEMVRQFHDAKLDYMVKSGLISQHIADQWKRDNKHWIPFVDVQGKATVFGRKGKGFQSRSTKRSIGSKKGRQIQEAITAEIEGLHADILNADRNRAIGQVVGSAQARLVWGLKKLDDKHQRTIIEPDGTEFRVNREGQGQGRDADFSVEIARKKIYGRLGPNDFLFYNHGKPEVWTAQNADVARMIRGMTPLDDITILKPAKWLAGLQRAGITRMPDYLAKMILRDQFVTPLLIKNGGVPFWNLGVGAMDMMFGKHGENAWDSFLRNGGMGASLASFDTNYLKRDIQGVFERAGTANRIVNLAKNPVDALRRVSERLDSVSRLGQYKRDVKNGMAPQAAAMKARRAYLDFKETGSSIVIQHWASVTPFFRPSILGYNQEYRALNEGGWKQVPKNAAVTMGKFTAYVALPTIALTLFNMMDDDTKEPNDPSRYDQIPEWQRYTHWILPEMGDARIRIPRAQGAISSFAGVVERFMYSWRSEDPHAFEDWQKEFMMTIGVPMVPSIAQYPIERWANKSTFTGQKIIPTSLENVSGYMQYTDSTTDLAINIAKSLEQNLGMEMSPLKVEHAIRSFTQGAGMAVIQLLDNVVPQERRERGPQGIADMPMVRSFIVRNPTMQASSIQTYYDLKSEFDKRQNDWRTALKRLNQDEMAMTSGYVQAFAKVDGIQQAINNVVRVIDLTEAAPSDQLTDEQKGEAIDNYYTTLIGLSKVGIGLIDSLNAAQEERAAALGLNNGE